MKRIIHHFARGALAAIALAFGGVALAGLITFTWTNPTTREDGTALTNLETIRVHCGTTSGGPYPTTQDFTPTQSGGANLTLPPGSYHCVATAIDADGLESAQTGEVSKVILPARPSPPVNFRLAP